MFSDTFVAHLFQAHFKHERLTLLTIGTPFTIYLFISFTFITKYPHYYVNKHRSLSSNINVKLIILMQLDYISLYHHANYYMISHNAYLNVSTILTSISLIDTVFGVIK
jgi:hypothetical protein